MPNELFNALGGGQNGFAAQFLRFMRMMQGQDPQAVIRQMLQSGRISQAQLDEAQRRAQEMRGMLDALRGTEGRT